LAAPLRPHIATIAISDQYWKLRHVHFDAFWSLPTVPWIPRYSSQTTIKGRLLGNRP